MIHLIKRTLKLHLRSGAGLVYSFMSVFLLLFVSFVFMKENMCLRIQQQMPSVPMKDIEWMVECWLMAGLLSITPVTTSCGILYYLVSDRDKSIIMDFKSMPLRKYDYPLGIVVSATLTGIIMTMVVMILYGAFIAIGTGHPFSAAQIALTILAVALISLCSACVHCFFMRGVQTISNYSGYSTILGTIIGFINAIYMPLGTLTTPVRWVVELVPFAGGAALLRSILMQGPLSAMLGGATAEQVSQFRLYFGIDYLFGNMVLPEWGAPVYMAVVSVIAFIIFMIHYNKAQEEY